ncbi:MAG: hypothetical protein IKE43_11185 [Coriobacteriales bacterium]|nr:hypothetical protein [Coriobacteriales bacterium]
MVIDRLSVYDTIYALASDKGCEKVLFGDCAPLAHKAFQQSLIGDKFPLLWFEVPLAGNPRFDLHVALSRESLHAGVQFLPGAGNSYDELFRWYSENETGGGGLTFAYDVSERRIDNPAVHVNVNNAPLTNISRFFDLVAGDGAYVRYSDFENRLPQGWRIWYTGVHPGRPGSPVRVDCFVSPALKAAYAGDITQLEHDLHACGFTATSPALRDLVMPILESPFSLELQFDVMCDNTLGTTLGVSAGFPFVNEAGTRKLFNDGGTIAHLMNRIEDMGLADKRWRHIPDATFATLIRVDGSALALYCVPTFLKMRMRDGKPLDAKTYLQAGASVLR